MAALERDRLQAELAAAQAALSEVQGRKTEGERERRAEEALQKLKAEFPDRVLGRLRDLFTVTLARDATAVMTALGRWESAVVTRDSDAAKACIAFLKLHKLGRASFIPMGDVVVQDIADSLRGLGGTVRPAVDCVEVGSGVDPGVRRALAFAMGKKLICDTHDEAKRVAYGKERHTVISLDGTRVDARGAVTGGTTESLSRSGGFDRGRYEQLKRAEAELRGKVEAQAEAVAAAKAAEEAAAKEVGALSESISMVEGKLGAHEQALERDRKAKGNLSKQLADVEERLGKCRAEAAALQPEMDRLQGEIKAAKAAIFADFCERMGVESVDEWERLHLTRAPEIERERKLLGAKVANLADQMEELRARNTEKCACETRMQSKACMSLRAFSALLLASCMPAPHRPPPRSLTSSCPRRSAAKAREKVAAIEAKLARLEEEGLGLKEEAKARRKQRRMLRDA